MPTPPLSPDELRRAIDPCTTLPNEDLDSPSVQDAVHWLSVYGECLALQIALLERADEELKGATDDAVKEAHLDQRLLRAQAERYLARRSFWAQRAKVLVAGGLPLASAAERSA